jgi:hypothetical protein
MEPAGHHGPELDDAEGGNGRGAHRHRFASRDIVD